MAKIRKISFNHLKKWYESHVEYVSSNNRSGVGDFFVRINERHREFLSTKKYEGKRKYIGRGIGLVISGNTEGEAIENWKEFMKEVLDAETLQEKVILYRFKGLSTQRDTEEDGGKNYFKKQAGNGDAREVEIEFDFMVCNKKSVGESKVYEPINRRDYRDIRDNVGTQISDYWVEVPYSQESEEFFKTIYNGLEKIIDMMVKHVGKKETTIASISSQIKLLQKPN